MSWNVLGHEWAETLLKHHITQGNTRHAYLFTGAPGTGRRTLALAFLKALDCEDPPAPGEFCDACRSCRGINRLQHMDLLIGQSEAPGETLKIDTVRDIQHDLNMLPYASPWRTALFLRFEEANTNAQNALLKTLEEPPERSKLLVTASNENALLPTISSRCEVLRLRPMSLASLQSELEKRPDVADSLTARRAAHMAAGRVGYAFRLIDDPGEMDRIETIASDAIDLLKTDYRSRFAYASDFKDTKKRGQLREILQIWQSVFRDLLLVSSAADQDLPLSFVTLQDRLTGLASKAASSQFRSSLSALNQSIAYLNGNVNMMLLLENLFLDWPKL